MILILVIEAQRPLQNLSVGVKQKRIQTHIFGDTVSFRCGSRRCCTRQCFPEIYAGGQCSTICERKKVIHNVIPWPNKLGENKCKTASEELNC